MAHDSSIGLVVWSDIFLRLAIMMVISAVVICFAFILGRSIKKARPRGVVIFGVLLILGSIYKLWGFLDYDYYRFMFQQLPEKVILARYFSSVTLRLAGLIAATGVLLLKDGFRKFLLLLCLFTLCSIYWKHPFYVFENISRYTEQQFLNKAGAGELTYPLHPWISLIFNYAVDIIFFGSALYYFTRSKIKEQFD